MSKRFSLTRVGARKASLERQARKSFEARQAKEQLEAGVKAAKPAEFKAAEPAEINHPAYYGGDTVYEAIKVIEAWGLNFSLGNCVKYISRAGKKDPTKLVEDLQKAAFYLNRAIENAQKGK